MYAPMTDEDIYRAEQQAADEDAELTYREMCEQADVLAQHEAASIAAEDSYRRNLPAVDGSDVF